MESIAIIAVAVISIFGNVIQFLLNKKANDIKSLDQQVALLSKLQKEQSFIYENANKLQENKIEGLELKVEEQEVKIKDYNKKLIELQRIISRLIGNGCHLEDCPNRSPYTVEEINEMTKKNKKDEKVYTRSKKEVGSRNTEILQDDSQDGLVY